MMRRSYRMVSMALSPALVVAGCQQILGIHDIPDGSGGLAGESTVSTGGGTSTSSVGGGGTSNSSGGGCQNVNGCDIDGVVDDRRNDAGCGGNGTHVGIYKLACTKVFSCQKIDIFISGCCLKGGKLGSAPDATNPIQQAVDALDAGACVEQVTGLDLAQVDACAVPYFCMGVSDAGGAIFVEKP
jgi:hypothetical protein